MPQHHETRILPYSPEQLFGLVSDIEQYPEFLPWCRAARIITRDGNRLEAELVISFKFMTESYVSKVTLHPYNAIEVDLLRGPFEKLDNHWKFNALPDGGTEIDFFIDFQFKSKILQKMIGGLFKDATDEMMQAFITRAHALFGIK